MNAERGIKAYYSEMENLPRGEYYVSGWKSDLKNLKHYNWIRNQISHEPGCTEENMCNPEDARWLDDFYHRIMNQTDPLARYRKATQPKVYRPAQEQFPRQSNRATPTRTKTRSNVVHAYMFLAIAFIVCFVIILKIALF